LPVAAALVVSMQQRNEKAKLNHHLAVGEKARNKMPRILCLHGKLQSGAIFSNKIAGARRKLERRYELHFLDGPMVNQTNKNIENNDQNNFDAAKSYSWWTKNEHNQHILVQEAFDYVMQQTAGESYDALLGFSQGGTLATALALTGAIAGVQAVVTAGAPMVQEAMDVAERIAIQQSKKYNDEENGEETGVTSAWQHGLTIPKLHLAGETDLMVPVHSTRTLSERAGNGELVIHEQGHLFPTRANCVNRILDFLDESIVMTDI